MPKVVLVAAALLLAACASAPPATPSQPTATAAAPPGSLANPRRLDCQNRNVWVPGEDKHPTGRTGRTWPSGRC